MKGIVKYQHKFYTKSKNTRGVKKGDLVKLECRRDNDHFKYNGIYTVVDDFKGILIPRVGELNLLLKLGYNIMYDEFCILKLSEKKRSTLPNVIKEEDYGI